jgi:segregation and condensation protein B
MSHTAHIEAILFVASKPMRIASIAKIVQISAEEVHTILEQLHDAYEARGAGIALAQSGDMVQLVTAPACVELVSQFQEKELTGELTKAQLETLTVIAYQQPITRPELEDIRGVNSSVILRTLLLRGLIVESQSPQDIFPVYELSIDALRGLGITAVTDLPEYEALHKHPHLSGDVEHVVSGEEPSGELS